MPVALVDDGDQSALVLRNGMKQQTIAQNLRRSWRRAEAQLDGRCCAIFRPSLERIGSLVLPDGRVFCPCGVSQKANLEQGLKMKLLAHPKRWLSFWLPFKVTPKRVPSSIDNFILFRLGAKAEVYCLLLNPSLPEAFFGVAQIFMTCLQVHISGHLRGARQRVSLHCLLHDSTACPSASALFRPIDRS